MKPKLLVTVAGLPTEIGEKFVIRFSKTFPIITYRPLGRTERYTHSYSIDLYERLAGKLKERGQSDRSNILKNVNLVLLYINKGDGSESVLFKEFGTEALLVPMKARDIAARPLKTRNQRGQVVNELVQSGKRAIRQAEHLLSVIAEEVTNRENKTCLLLPRKNFGKNITEVFDCVHHASLKGEGRDEFKNRLKNAARSLPTVREGRRTYFGDQGRFVFKSPAKAGARHGLAPEWDTSGHELSCVIRGRIRFGVSYNPKFHYDCTIPKGIDRRLPSCHGFRQISQGRTYVNIAPNDNIRG